jgi:hypothetical protein
MPYTAPTDEVFTVRRKVKGQKHELLPTGSIDFVSRSVRTKEGRIVEAADNLGDKITRRSAIKWSTNKKGR